MNRSNAKDSLKKFYGMEPYNTMSNHCRGDGYFARSIGRDFSLEEINKANRELGKELWD
jgi:hypothetical protein